MKEPCRHCGWAFSPDCYPGNKSHDHHDLGEWVKPGSPIYVARVDNLVDEARQLLRQLTDTPIRFDLQIFYANFKAALEVFNDPMCPADVQAHHRKKENK
jgi:hypothetical protein